MISRYLFHIMHEPNPASQMVFHSYALNISNDIFKLFLIQTLIIDFHVLFIK